MSRMSSILGKSVVRNSHTVNSTGQVAGSDRQTAQDRLQVAIGRQQSLPKVSTVRLNVASLECRHSWFECRDKQHCANNNEQNRRLTDKDSTRS